MPTVLARTQPAHASWSDPYAAARAFYQQNKETPPLFLFHSLSPKNSAHTQYTLVRLCEYLGINQFVQECHPQGFMSGPQEDHMLLRRGAELALACLVDGKTPEESWREVDQVRRSLRALPIDDETASAHTRARVRAVQCLEDCATHALGDEKVRWPTGQPIARATQVGLAWELPARTPEGVPLAARVRLLDR